MYVAPYTWYQYITFSFLLFLDDMPICAYLVQYFCFGKAQGSMRGYSKGSCTLASSPSPPKCVLRQDERAFSEGEAKTAAIPICRPLYVDKSVRECRLVCFTTGDRFRAKQRLQCARFTWCMHVGIFSFLARVYYMY